MAHPSTMAALFESMKGKRVEISLRCGRCVSGLLEAVSSEMVRLSDPPSGGGEGPDDAPPDPPLFIRIAEVATICERPARLI